MPDQALFAYRVQLPDGSEAVRTGGADTAPTYGQLADYAANQGEKFLGHVDMSPAPRPAPPPPPAQAPPPSVPPPSAEEAPLPSMVAAGGSTTPAAAPPPPPSLFAAGRSLPSQGLSIVGGVGGGLLGAATGPYAVVASPALAGAGSALGEAAQVGAENLFGWPAAESGTLTERAERAAVRGAAGEGAGQVLRLGAQGVAHVVGPTLRAAEELAPALAQDLPAGTQAVESATPGMFRNIDRVLQSPAVLAKAQLSPEGQQTLFRAWWQRQAPQGAGAVVNAWDALAQTPGAQQALAGGQHEAVSTLVDSLRPAVQPLQNLSWGQLSRGAGTASVPAYLVAHAGHPYLAPVAGAASQYATAQLPRAFLSPTMGPFLAKLPAAAEAVATPTDYLLRTGGQYLGGKAFP